MPIPIATRFKDALWSLRERFGVQPDVDRIIPFVAFGWKLTAEKLEQLFLPYTERVPEDFKAALIAQIQEATRNYWGYVQTRKGFHRILKDIIFLENVARFGENGFRLRYDENTGYHLEIKR